MTTKRCYFFFIVQLFLLTNCSDDFEKFPLEQEMQTLPVEDFNYSSSCDPAEGSRKYEVGPDKEYQNLVDVPFENLQPGDVVSIHAREEPYYEKILLTQSGTEELPIIICGVPDAEGNLPTISGKNARSRNTDMKNIVASLGVIAITKSNSQPYGTWPKNIEIKNLRVIGANQYLSDDSQQFYDMVSGELVPYSAGAAGIRIQMGENIKIQNNIIEYNGNGIFAVTNGEMEMTRNIHLYGNIIRNNGTKDIDRHHNIYIEVDGLTSIGNQFGPIREGAKGGNYKSRSAGDRIMYNRFVGPAARQLDLVESQNGYGFIHTLPSFRVSYFIGNVIEGSEDGAASILHYGGDGDNGTPSDDLRQGTIYCYNNTFVLKGNKEKSWRKMFCDLNTCNEKLYAFNNIFFYENPGGAEDSEVSMFRYNGSVSHFSNNLISESVAAWYKTDDDQNPCGEMDFGIIENMKISNTDFDMNTAETGKSYHPMSESRVVDNGMEIPEALPLVDKQFKYPNGIEDRTINGESIDIGAFEFQ
ncbi:hypothetical protein [Flagellimonas algicola]|uniref:Parallel beta helix pectate lyase-like protein n=1 Tax=Flagellimonas algicola TaxID=2583815 RepID=A0ABY2WHL7_9FLAO|nr:hypothetical protein [Allomuricauda algicola]TMU50763.1 hypothetical protein FGG15_18370 [Allomuricauda algicola]